MPRIIEYTENEGSGQTSATTLMTLINQSKSATAGINGFAVKAIVVSSSSAVIFGLCSSMMLTPLLGPALSFLSGASFGFVGGCVHRWRTDVADALSVAEEFPALMEHHLRTADESILRRTTFAEWRRELPRSPVAQGHAIAALYSAGPALQRIREAREEEVIAEELEAAAAARAAAAAAAAAAITME